MEDSGNGTYLPSSYRQEDVSALSLVCTTVGDDIAKTLARAAEEGGEERYLSAANTASALAPYRWGTDRGIITSRRMADSRS